MAKIPNKSCSSSTGPLPSHSSSPLQGQPVRALLWISGNKGLLRVMLCSLDHKLTVVSRGSLGTPNFGGQTVFAVRQLPPNTSLFSGWKCLSPVGCRHGNVEALLALAWSAEWLIPRRGVRVPSSHRASRSDVYWTPATAMPACTLNASLKCSHNTYSYPPVPD